MGKRRVVHLLTGAVVVAVVGAGLSVTHSASATESFFSTSRPVNVRAVQAAPPQIGPIIADFEPVAGSAEHDPLESGIDYTIGFTHEGTMSVGASFPLAPSYQVTISVPGARYLDCNDGTVRTNPCTFTVTRNWASRQTRTFTGRVAPLAVSNGKSGALTMTYSVKSALPDPDGATGTLDIKAEK